MQPNDTRYRMTLTMLMAIGVGLGVLVGVVTSDVVIGVIAGAGFIALTVNTVRVWTAHGGSSPSRS